MIDESTLISLARDLPKHGYIALGEISGDYLMVLLPDALKGLDTQGKTRLCPDPK